MASPLEMRKRNITYIRGVFTFLILMMALYNIGDILASQQYVLAYLALLVASNIVFIALPINLYEGIKLHYIIFILDIIFVALGAYWLAFLDFPFLIIIFLTIFISALGQSVKTSLLTAVVVNALYFYMKLSMADSGIATLAERNIFLNIPFIFMVALHSSYLAEKANEDINERKKLEKANKMLSGQLKNMSAEMESAHDFMELTYDGFRDGVMVLDENGNIRQFNRKCESIFGIKRARAINMLYTEVEVLGGVQGLITDLKAKKQPSFDRDITVEAGGAKKILVVNTSFIKDGAENINGIICTLRQRFENKGGEI
jgi:PAS domain S-box-containing protein